MTVTPDPTTPAAAPTSPSDYQLRWESLDFATRIASIVPQRIGEAEAKPVDSVLAGAAKVYDYLTAKEPANPPTDPSATS